MLAYFELRQVRTDLSDAHLYIFNRAALLRVLEVRPAFTSIKQVHATVGLPSLLMSLCEEVAEQWKL